MSRKLSLFLLALLVPVTAADAQTAAAGPQPGNVVLVAQYECNPAEASKVDTIIKEVGGQVLNRYVKEGKLMSWGWLATTVGGPVNRTVYVWATDMQTLMQAREGYLPEIMGNKSWAEVGRICPRQQVTINNLVAVSGQ